MFRSSTLRHPSHWSVPLAGAIALGSVTLGVALGWIALGPVTPPALTQDARPTTASGPLLRTLTVSGQGNEPIQTTLAQVNLGIEVQGKTADEVQAQAAQRSSAVVDYLKNQGVEKLQTTGINLSPRYSYDNNRQRLDGYTASNSVSFRVPTTKAGRIMDQAVKAGATRIDGISFIATDAAIATARQAALKQATQKARQEADTVLDALNLQAKDIVSIQVDGATTPPPPYPMPVGAFREAKAADAVTPVVAGEQEVRASVTLQIRY